jgi:hypothetical protein
VSKQLQLDARELELQRALDETMGSISWRITAPLRRLNAWRKRLGRRA